MRFKMKAECMDKKCKTVIVGNNLDGVSCTNCGGPTWTKPFDSTEKQVKKDKIKGLTIELNVETTEALKGIKEVTEAANECVTAFEKLEKIIGKFTGQAETVELYCDGKVIAQSTIKQTTDSIRMTVTDIKGVK